MIPASRRHAGLLRSRGFAGLRLRRGFTLIELLVVIAIIGILVSMLLPSVIYARRLAKNSVAKTTLHGLEQALAVYEADFGAHPNAGSPLSADTTVFVRLLRIRGPKGTPYYDFKDGLNDRGELLSVLDEPYRYSWPGDAAPGPDGFYHPGRAYLLWTAGCVQGEPDRQWEINSWSIH
jgi:prepilin-type N-terminal cleavage/methylation domain-containing protein